jgi:hypothetical protein
MTKMQTSLSLLIVWPSILNLVINFSTHLWSVKWNALGYTFALRIFIPSSPMSMQHMYQHDQQWYDPLHIITWSYWFIDLDLLALHRCFGPSAPSHHLIFPSHLQPVRRAKSCLDLFHLDYMTQCHVSCAISFFIITCVSFATFLSHFHLHGICCSYTYTYGLITCVSHLNTISLPKIVTRLLKSNKDLSCWLLQTLHCT